jgi:hypothetical protein
LGLSFIGAVVGEDGNGGDLELGVMFDERRGMSGAMVVSLGVEVWVFLSFCGHYFHFLLTVTLNWMAGY